MLIAKLRELQKRIDPLFEVPGSPLNLSFVDCARECLVLGIRPGSLTLSLREAIAKQTRGWPVRLREMRISRQGKEQRHRPVVGGLKIVRMLPPSSVEVGTICVTAEKGKSKGFLTAGHVAHGIGSEIFQPSTGSGNSVGKVVLESKWKVEAYSDSSFVVRDWPRRTVPVKGTVYETDTVNYKVKEVLNDPQEVLNKTVRMQGYTVEGLREGNVVAVDAKVQFVETLADGSPVQAILKAQVIATYGSNSGDSGGTVFQALDGDGVAIKLVGLNVGVAQETNIIPPPAAETYGICSPWSGIIRDLGAFDVIHPDYA